MLSHPQEDLGITASISYLVLALKEKKKKEEKKEGRQEGRKERLQEVHWNDCT